MTDISLRFDSYRQTEAPTNGPRKGADAFSFESFLPRDSASGESRNSGARGTDDIPVRLNDNARADESRRQDRRTDRTHAADTARRADARDRDHLAASDRADARDRDHLAASDHADARDRARDAETRRNRDHTNKDRANAADGERRRSLENATPLNGEMQPDPARGDRPTTAADEEREPTGNDGAADSGPDPRVVFANQHRNDPREPAGEATGNADHPSIDGLPVDDNSETRGETGDGDIAGSDATDPADIEALLAALAALQAGNSPREGEATDTGQRANPESISGAGVAKGVPIPDMTGTGEAGKKATPAAKADKPIDPAPTLASAAPASTNTANDNKAAMSRDALIDLIGRLQALDSGTGAKAIGEQDGTANIDLDTASRKDLLNMARTLAASAAKAGATLTPDDRAAIKALLAAQDATTPKPATEATGSTAGRTAGAETTRIVDPAAAATNAAARPTPPDEKAASRITETTGGDETARTLRETAVRHTDRTGAQTAAQDAAQGVARATDQTAARATTKAAPGTAPGDTDVRVTASAAVGASGTAKTGETEVGAPAQRTTGEAAARPAPQATQTAAEEAAQTAARTAPGRGRAANAAASATDTETADDAPTGKTAENTTRTADATRADNTDRTAATGEISKPKPVTHADLAAAANREPSRIAAEAKVADAGAKSGSGEMKTAAQALTDAAGKAADDGRASAAATGRHGEKADTAAALTNVAAAKSDIVLTGSSSDQLMVLQSDHRMGHDAMTQAQRAVATLSRGTPVVPGVAAEIARFASKGDSRFEIRLDPPELGRVDVRLKVKDDGTVKAHLFVERSETLDGFLRDQRGLERALEQAGLKTDSGSLQFSLKSDTGTGQGGTFADDNGSPSWTASEDTGDIGEMDRMSPTYSTAAIDGRLDIRV